MCILMCMFMYVCTLLWSWQFERTYCHSHNNSGPRNGLQRFFIPVHFWKTVENLKPTLNYYENGSTYWSFQTLLHFHMMHTNARECGMCVCICMHVPCIYIYIYAALVLSRIAVFCIIYIHFCECGM
jgi:hypothetical protein